MTGIGVDDVWGVTDNDWSIPGWDDRPLDWLPLDLDWNTDWLNTDWDLDWLKPDWDALKPDWLPLPDPLP